MAGLRTAAPLLGVAAILLCSCGQSGGGGTASSRPAASSAPSDTPVSSAAASALPPVAAAAATVTPAAANEPQRREPTAAELLRDDPGYAKREQRLEALYENAKERDPTGQVERAHAAALAERRACADRACLDAWFRRREAALRQYVEN
jgi:hypothetical protein